MTWCVVTCQAQLRTMFLKAVYQGCSHLLLYSEWLKLSNVYWKKNQDENVNTVKSVNTALCSVLRTDLILHPHRLPTHIIQAFQQPVAIRYCWAYHHGSKCSIIFPQLCFRVQALAHTQPSHITFSCAETSLSFWVFPGPVGEQPTCKQNSDAVTVSRCSAAH